MSLKHEILSATIPRSYVRLFLLKPTYLIETTFFDINKLYRNRKGQLWQIPLAKSWTTCSRLITCSSELINNCNTETSRQSLDFYKRWISWRHLIKNSSTKIPNWKRKSTLWSRSRGSMRSCWTPLTAQPISWVSHHFTICIHIYRTQKKHDAELQIED